MSSYSPRFAFLVLEAREKGELSEGQAARMLRMDRVSMRRLVEDVLPNAAPQSRLTPLMDWIALSPKRRDLAMALAKSPATDEDLAVLLALVR